MVEKIACFSYPLFRYSNGAIGNVTRSQTHDGFDNDATTMNHVLRTVLGKALPEPFKPEKLRY